MCPDTSQGIVDLVIQGENSSPPSGISELSEAEFDRKRG
jgi:hypothetical protein